MRIEVTHLRPVSNYGRKKDLEIKLYIRKAYCVKFGLEKYKLHYI